MKFAVKCLDLSLVPPFGELADLAHAAINRIFELFHLVSLRAVKNHTRTDTT